MTNKPARKATKAFAALLLGLAIVAGTFTPIADDALTEIGLEQAAAAPAAAGSEFNNAFCWVLGGAASQFGPVGVATSGVVAFACTRPHFNADAVCADKVTAYKHNAGVYGSVTRYRVEGKYWLTGRSTCLVGDWQFKGGVYGSQWVYIRGRR